MTSAPALPAAALPGGTVPPRRAPPRLPPLLLRFSGLARGHPASGPRCHEGGKGGVLSCPPPSSSPSPSRQPPR